MRPIATALLLSLAGAPAFAQGTGDLDAARASIAAGEVQAALAPLERILLARPEADDARLLYARTLYDLGDYEGAERELRLLEGRLGPGDAAYARDLRHSAVARSKAFRGRGAVFAGIRAESDPGLGTLDAEDDTAAVAGLDLRLEHEIAGTGGGLAFGDLRLRGALYDEAEELDGLGGALTLGLELPYADLTLIPYLTASSERTDDGGRLDAAGGGLALRYALTKTTGLTFGLERETRWQRDSDIRGEGDARRAEIGLRSRPMPGVLLGAAIATEEFDADGDALSYTAPELTLDASYAFDDGGLLFGRAIAIERDYDDEGDESIRDYFVGYARPFTFAGLEGLTLQVGLRHEHRRSDFDARDGRNTSLEVTLLRNFEF
ncbi:tetratricopeptide repeat protein [Tropicimonas sp. IMCC34011]|uniref:tetratricopeptide repeat protein n=1 Tax=Tropicimonas sp. IMCC34011 TaxID=2248759 RepID=UPI000E22984E|nr:tetratricopeptide repeat protein [Tropicimonas sp. IMCC34011]